MKRGSGVPGSALADGEPAWDHTGFVLYVGTPSSGNKRVRGPAMVGDSGSGGTQGEVPAPAVGDALKFLRGDGTWAAAGVSGMGIKQGSTPTCMLFIGVTSPAGSAYAVVNSTGTGSAGAGSVGTTSVTLGGITYYYYAVTLTAGETATLGDLSVVANDGLGGNVAEQLYQVVA